MTTSFAPTVPTGEVKVSAVAVLLTITALAPPTVTVLTVERLVPEIPVLTPPCVVPEFGEIEVIVGAGQLAISVTIVGLPGSTKPFINAVFPGFTTQVRVCNRNAPLVLVSTDVRVLGREIHLST
jgi:hypothetical protein